MVSFSGRLKHAWDAFTSTSDGGAGTWDRYGDMTYTSSFNSRPHVQRLNTFNDRSFIGSLYTRLGIDVANVKMRHVRVDKNDRYLETIKSGLNNCLTVEANLDQAATAFRQDMAMTLFDKGVMAIVPVETTLNPNVTGSYDVTKLRVGHILEWYPKHVKVSVYNEKVGKREDIVLSKSIVGIVENPLYNVMNEPNSTLQRLLRKLALLDGFDEQLGSGKLDIIIQLPYVIKSEARRQQAEQRRRDIENQLKGAQYGIAYTDGTERITQLNRPAENNLLVQITTLTEQLYNQLGISKAVFEGTASESEMLNYHNRTIAPVLDALVEAMRRVFITKTGRSQGQSIMYFRDPFALTAVTDIAEMSDKFTRNEILSPNDIRSIIGMQPSTDPEADKLRNRNMPVEATGDGSSSLEEELQNGT